MVRTLIIAAFIIFAFTLPVKAQEFIEGEPTGIQPAAGDAPKKTIVLFYADWCPACKILKPRLYDVIEKLEFKDQLKIIQFDFSNDLTQVESAGLAGEHNLSDLYNEYSPGTGFAVLVDRDKELFEQTRLTTGDTAYEIEDKIRNYTHNPS